MADKTTKWWELAYRADLAWSWGWPWLVKAIPIVIATIATYLAALDHLRPWQLFLAAVYGLAGGLGLVLVGMHVYGKWRLVTPAAPAPSLPTAGTTELHDPIRTVGTHVKPSVNPTSPLPGPKDATNGHDISLGWIEEPHSLSFELRNNTASIVQGCGIGVEGLKLWSPEHKAWIMVSGFYSEKGEFRLFALHGNRTIFAKDTSHFLFISAVGGKYRIQGRIEQGQYPLPVGKPGIWRAEINVTWAGQVRSETVFYESFTDRTKRPSPASDPSEQKA